MISPRCYVGVPAVAVAMDVVVIVVARCTCCRCCYGCLLLLLLGVPVIVVTMGGLHLPNSLLGAIRVSRDLLVISEVLDDVIAPPSCGPRDKSFHIRFVLQCTHIDGFLLRYKNGK